MSRNQPSLLVLSVAATIAISLGGCKKPPPPPPQGACCAQDGTCAGPMVQADCSGQWVQDGACEPNPCQQPEKPALDFKQVAENEKIDPRVQIGDGVSLTDDRLDLAKAIIHLADALAKGDAKTIKPLLTRRAQNLLSDLQNSGGWEEGTKQIEAVRIVLVRDGVEFGAVGAPAIPAAEVLPSIMLRITQALKELPPEQLKAITEATALAGNDSAADPAALMKDPAKLAEFSQKVAEAMKAAGVSDEFQQKIADLVKPSTDAAPADPAASLGSGLGVILAVQDVHGAYVLGWQAEKVGDQWAFSNAAATPDIRPRASLWDGVGVEAFQAMHLASAPAAMNTEAAPVPGTPMPRDGGGDAPGSPAPTENPGGPPSTIPKGPHDTHPPR